MALRFHSWQRSKVMDGATEAGGRLQGKIPLAIDDAADINPPTQLQLNVLFRGPGDVAALKSSSAIKHMAPGPSTADAETTKLVHIDFFEPDLPWRYSPKLPVNDASSTTNRNRLLPWIVLLVGTPDEFKVIDGRVQPAGPVVSAFDLKNAYRWAHVHEDDGYFISRLVSPRVLAPLSSYTAAVVPAFDANGGFRWAGTSFSGELPAFHSWRFQTGEQGDFETLAAALRVRKKLDLGTAWIRYRRPLGNVDVTLETGGAITSLKALPNPADEIKKARADLDLVNNELTDEIPQGEIPAPPKRPHVLQLPRYGAPWLHDRTDAVQWSKSMNDDPRHRGVAGIGLRMGIVEQEALMTAAVEQAGALQDASARIGFLALGIGMSGKLWERRLPKSTELRLRIFGPVMGRMLAEGGGTVLDQVTAQGSTLERALFSSTAMRLTRDSTARARHAKGGRFDRAALLSRANKPLPASPDVPPGLPHVDAIAKELGLQPVDQILPGQKFPDKVEDLIAKFTGQPATPAVIDEFAKLAGAVLGLDCRASITGYFPKLFPRPLALERILLINALNACRAQKLSGERRERYLDLLLPPPARPNRRRPVNLGPLATAVGGAIDPTKALPPAWIRVIGTIDIKGVVLKSLEPLEAPIGLDFPTWTLLKKNDPEWLLPGVGQVEPDTVSALKTNPTFIEAYMVGINTQFLAEMRWRNLPAPRVSTPLRMFWGYYDFSKNKREADIQAIANWPSLPKDTAGADDVGSLSHQAAKPGDAKGKEDLIVAFRTALFRRYPSTLVYLVRPPLLGPSGQPLTDMELNVLLTQVPNFKEAPVKRDDRRFFGPIFQGEIQPDLVFFAFDVDPADLKQYWLVLDEPPAELRFRNDRGLDFDNSSVFAAKTIDHPTRVAISGKELEAMAVNP